ncbi:hypothetical protein ABZ851_29120 [Streptomyces sp. NPDC047049]|uniref:hypothetical protein n=1 Tax=Streptomyces sp. NPDC047049 TaxID=3156688 RepID=UPI0033FFDF23
MTRAPLIVDDPAAQKRVTHAPRRRGHGIEATVSEETRPRSMATGYDQLTVRHEATVPAAAINDQR